MHLYLQGKWISADVELVANLTQSIPAILKHYFVVSKESSKQSV
jgi:hypothetical protein